MVYYIKSNKNYYYKVYKNNMKKRISKKEYLKNKKGGNINNSNQNSIKMIDIVKSWINIENILFRTYNKRNFLNKNYNFNKCERLNNCSLDSNCKIYHSQSQNKNKCVHKNRIKTFEGNFINPLILKGKNNKEYELIKTIPFLFENNFNDINYDIIIYSQFIIKIINDKKYLLVIFNSGQTYPKKFYENIQYKNYLNELYSLIKDFNQIKEFDNILFCGHSMGADNAIFLTLFMIENDEQFYIEKCFTLISGISNILNDDEIEILKCNTTPYSNIVLFMNGVFENDKYYIDSRYTNFSKLNFYYPFIYLYLNLNNETFDYKIIQNIDDLHSYQFITNTNMSASIHNWSFYYDNINAFLQYF